MIQKIAIYFSISCLLFCVLAQARRQQTQDPQGKQNETSTAARSFEQLKPLLYQVKTSSGATAEKSSYGTGFVVDKNGYLLTNYHVVAGAVWRPSAEKVFVVYNQDNVPAEIIDVDVVHDLALIRIAQIFPKTIQIASGHPSAGATLHSLGLPEDLDWTVVNGVYNGLIKRGPYELIHLTTPLNPGMSGGPTVNTHAELIGINVSGLLFSQSISFAVPLRFAMPLITLSHSKDPLQTKAKNSEELIQSIYTQLKKVQNDLALLTLKSLESSKTLEGWQVPKLGNAFKCWGQKSPESETSHVLNYEKCEIEHRTQLTHEISTAFVRIETSLIENREMNFFSYFNFLNTLWAQDDMDSLQFFSKEIKVNYGPYECQRSFVSAPQKIQIEVCTRPLIPFFDLFEIHVKAMTRVGIKQTLLSYMILDGFDKSNFSLVLAKYLQNFGKLLP